MDVFYACSYICTSFNHDQSQDTFNGEAILASHVLLEAWEGSTSLAASTLSFLSALSLDVETGTYDTVGSVGLATLTGTIGPFIAFDGLTITSAEATIDLSMTLDGVTAVTGVIEGQATFHPDGGSPIVSSAAPAPYSLAVGVLCS